MCGGLARRAVLLVTAEDAFGHDWDARSSVSRGSSIDDTLAALK
jgi:hypothetical protein